MNREIKFRAIDALTGKMVYGDFTHGQKITRTGLTPRLMVGGYEVVSETVGQFVELLDINKKEIYEGDIIRLNDNIISGIERIKVVKYIPQYARVCFSDISDIQGCMKYWETPCMDWWPDFIGCIEVIGNIHENPELLKGGNQ